MITKAVEGWRHCCFLILNTTQNRTAGWGQCCNLPRDKEVREFLDHPMTLALFVGQHHNTSHPKVVTLPRGLPTTWGSTRVLVWDMIRENLQKVRKDKLLFAAASGWGPRPQILRCVSNKFDPADFDGHVKNAKQPRLDRVSYYQKLSGARFGRAKPLHQHSRPSLHTTALPMGSQTFLIAPRMHPPPVRCPSGVPSDRPEWRRCHRDEQAGERRRGGGRRGHEARS